MSRRIHKLILSLRESFLYCNAVLSSESVGEVLNVLKGYVSMKLWPSRARYTNRNIAF